MNNLNIYACNSKPHNLRWTYRELQTIGNCFYVNGIFEVEYSCSDDHFVRRPKDLCLYLHFVCKFQPVLFSYHLCGPSTRFGSSAKPFENQRMKSRTKSRNVSECYAQHFEWLSSLLERSQSNNIMEFPSFILLIKLFVHSVSDVIFSAIGSIVWIVAIITWVLTFQLNRADWGEFADKISFIIPLGRA